MRTVEEWLEAYEERLGHQLDTEAYRASHAAWDAASAEYCEALERIRDRAQRIVKGEIKTNVWDVAEYDIQVVDGVLGENGDAMDETQPSNAMLEPGYHSGNGWYFMRLEDGSVRIRKVAMSGGKVLAPYCVVFEVTIPSAEWVSVVAAVAKDGGTAIEYERAEHVHEGERLSDATCRGAPAKGG